MERKSDVHDMSKLGSERGLLYMRRTADCLFHLAITTTLSCGATILRSQSTFGQGHGHIVIGLMISQALSRTKMEDLLPFRYKPRRDMQRPRPLLRPGSYKLRNKSATTAQSFSSVMHIAAKSNKSQTIRGQELSFLPGGSGW